MNKKILSLGIALLFMTTAFFVTSGKVTIEDPEETGIIQDRIDLPDPLQVDMVLEPSICRRMSFRSYTTTPVTDEELSTVLWAAYGLTAQGGRTVYSPNGTYSTTLYVIRSDATYIYVPADHSLLLWKTGNYLNLGQYNAPINFGLVWNRSIAADKKAGMAEIGMIAQNIYFDANALDLATITCGGGLDFSALDLPSNEEGEIIMELGHPSPAYNFRYDPLDPANLPSVVNNTMTLAEAVTDRQIAYEWNTTELTLLEESQILWASYGTSYLYDQINNKRHRTLPSAVNKYPFKVYAANQTGVYQYMPATHSITLIVSGDKRELIQNAVDPGNISVSSSPWIIIPFWDGSSSQYLPWWWYESGAIVHNVLLEAAALNLSGNVLSVITDQNALRSALGLSAQPNLVAMHLALVGHVNQSSQNNPPLAPSISGPSNGQKGVLYEYTVATTDPDGDDVYYWVDWGDGTNTGWVGPFPSGMMIQLNHSWSEAGTYTMLVGAKDTKGAESIWTPYDMTIAGPHLSIQIRQRGFGAAATITNDGTERAENVTWTITLDGGIVVFGKSKQDTISSIAIDESVTVTSFTFGLLKSTVSVTAADSSESLEVFLLGPLIL